VWKTAPPDGRAGIIVIRQGSVGRGIDIGGGEAQADPVGDLMIQVQPDIIILISRTGDNALIILDAPCRIKRRLIVTAADAEPRIGQRGLDAIDLLFIIVSACRKIYSIVFRDIPALCRNDGIREGPLAQELGYSCLPDILVRN